MTLLRRPGRRGDTGFDRLGDYAPAPRQRRDRSDDAARQEERDGDEETAEREQPGFRYGAGEVALGEVDEDGPDRRSDQRAAPADRDPDHDFDRIGGRELARVDDADLRHIERAGDPGHAGRQHEDEQLVVFDAVAEEARAALGIAHGDQHLAQAGIYDGVCDQEAERQHRSRGEEQRSARAAGLDVKPRMSLKSVMPLLPPKPMSL